MVVRLDGRGRAVVEVVTSILSSVLVELETILTLILTSFVDFKFSKCFYFKVWLPGRRLCRLVYCGELGLGRRLTTPTVEESSSACPLYILWQRGVIIFSAGSFNVLTNRVDDGRMTLSKAWR